MTMRGMVREQTWLLSKIDKSYYIIIKTGTKRPAIGWSATGAGHSDMDLLLFFLVLNKKVEKGTNSKES